LLRPVDSGIPSVKDRPSQHPTRPRIAVPADAVPPEGPRRLDSSSATLPGPYAVPRCLVEQGDIEWFAPLTARVLALVDGTRSIQQIAADAPMGLGEAQLRIADLKERGVIAVE